MSQVPYHSAREYGIVYAGGKAQRVWDAFSAGATYIPIDQRHPRDSHGEVPGEHFALGVWPVSRTRPRDAGLLNDAVQRGWFRLDDDTKRARAGAMDSHERPWSPVDVNFFSPEQRAWFATHPHDELNPAIGGAKITFGLTRPSL